MSRYRTVWYWARVGFTITAFALMVSIVVFSAPVEAQDAISPGEEPPAQVFQGRLYWSVSGYLVEIPPRHLRGEPYPYRLLFVDEEELWTLCGCAAESRGIATMLGYTIGSLVRINRDLPAEVIQWTLEHEKAHLPPNGWHH